MGQLGRGLAGQLHKSLSGLSCPPLGSPACGALRSHLAHRQQGFCLHVKERAGQKNHGRVPKQHDMRGGATGWDRTHLCVGGSAQAQCWKGRRKSVTNLASPGSRLPKRACNGWRDGCGEVCPWHSSSRQEQRQAKGLCCSLATPSCFFPDLGSSPSPLPFLLLPAPLLTHTQGWPQFGQKTPMAFAPWARHWSLTPWLSHLVMPHCFQHCWQRSREHRMASHPLV